MAPAYGRVCLLQNPSSGNGEIPGCSFILSVDIRVHPGWIGWIGVVHPGLLIVADYVISDVASPLLNRRGALAHDVEPRGEAQSARLCRPPEDRHRHLSTRSTHG